MPSKKRKDKGGSDKAKFKEKIKAEWDDLSITTLEEYVSNLDSNNRNEVCKRVFAQTEHNTVNEYCNVTRNDIRKLHMQIELIEQRIEAVANNNDNELNVYDEKTKHLIFDHTMKLQSSEDNKLTSLNKEREEHELQIVALEGRQMNRKEELRKQEIVFSEEIKQIKMRYDKELTKIHETLNAESRNLQDKCLKHQEETKGQLDQKKKEEQNEMEEQSNAHMLELERHHQEACQQIKSHYENMFKENSTGLRQLQDDNNRLEEVESKYQTLIKELEEQNNRLYEPLKESLVKVNVLKGKIKDKDKNKLSLRNMKIRRIATDERLRQQMDDYEVLQKNFNKVRQERDELRAEMTGITLEFSVKSNGSEIYFKNRFHDLTESVTKTGLQLDKFLEACGMKDNDTLTALSLQGALMKGAELTIGQLECLAEEGHKRIKKMLEMFQQELKASREENNNLSITLQSSITKHTTKQLIS